MPKYPLTRPRTDGLHGEEVVTQTTQGYVEPPGVDKRVKRVRVLGSEGKVEKTYLEDEIGAPFLDNLGYPDRKK